MLIRGTSEKNRVLQVSNRTYDLPIQLREPARMKIPRGDSEKTECSSDSDDTDNNDDDGNDDYHYDNDNEVNEDDDDKSKINNHQ